jgi:hypothetical protein
LQTAATILRAGASSPDPTLAPVVVLTVGCGHPLDSGFEDRQPLGLGGQNRVVHFSLCPVQDLLIDAAAAQPHGPRHQLIHDGGPGLSGRDDQVAVLSGGSNADHEAIDAVELAPPPFVEQDFRHGLVRDTFSDLPGQGSLNCQHGGQVTGFCYGRSVQFLLDDRSLGDRQEGCL